MNFTTNKWWGGGNLFLICMQLFQFAQLASVLPLLWNSEMYLYDFRFWRFISFAGAGLFDLIYVAVSFDFVQLVFGTPFLSKEKANDPYDLLRALIMGYCMYYFFPTIMVNGPLFLKELTLSQSAWSPDEDYPEGYLLDGMINLDILYWFGVEEDSDWYYNWL